MSLDKAVLVLESSALTLRGDSALRSVGHGARSASGSIRPLRRWAEHP